VTPTDLVLRPAEPGDAAEVALLYREARTAAVPAIPPSVHTAPQERAWLAARLADPGYEAWVAETDLLVGYALFTPTWLDHLYVRPGCTGQGVGGALLRTVQALRPHGLGLWAFETNHRARAFYRLHGFVEVERTDGSQNEEQAPDVRMVWPG